MTHRSRCRENRSPDFIGISVVDRFASNAECVRFPDDPRALNNRLFASCVDRFQMRV